MTLTIYSPPKAFPFQGVSAVSIFLAGSIEMGKAVDWQKEVISELEKSGLLLDIFNPRRDDWDSSWGQTIKDEKFREQVEWELYGIDLADIILMYFAPGTMSPISLLELGLILGKYPDKLVVVCPEGFYRKGNVDITCKKYGVQVHTTLDDALKVIKYA